MKQFVKTVYSQQLKIACTFELSKNAENHKVRRIFERVKDILEKFEIKVISKNDVAIKNIVLDPLEKNAGKTHTLPIFSTPRGLQKTQK